MTRPLDTTGVCREAKAILKDLEVGRRKVIRYPDREGAKNVVRSRISVVAAGLWGRGGYSVRTLPDRPLVTVMRLR